MDLLRLRVHVVHGLSTLILKITHNHLCHCRHLISPSRRHHTRPEQRRAKRERKHAYSLVREISGVKVAVDAALELFVGHGSSSIVSPNASSASKLSVT